MLATCSWEACEVDVPLKGCGGSFAPLLGDIAGLQPWQDNVPSWCHFIMQSEVARTRGLHCNPGLLSHLQPGTEKPKICSVTTLLVDRAQKPVWVLGHSRCEPSPNKCVCWKVYYYISTVLRDFLHKKKGPVFSSPLAANLQENELGAVCINETIKESLESWKLSLLAQSSCQNWLNFRHPFSSPAQKRKEVGWGWEEMCVW